MGPSEPPAWLLKDSMNISVGPLYYPITAFFNEVEIPNHLKQAFVTPVFKRLDSEIPKSVDLYQLLLLYPKFWRK